MQSLSGALAVACVLVLAVPLRAEIIRGERRVAVGLLDAVLVVTALAAVLRWRGL